VQPSIKAPINGIMNLQCTSTESTKHVVSVDVCSWWHKWNRGEKREMRETRSAPTRDKGAPTIDYDDDDDDDDDERRTMKACMANTLSNRAEKPCNIWTESFSFLSTHPPARSLVQSLASPASRFQAYSIHFHPLPSPIPRVTTPPLSPYPTNPGDPSLATFLLRRSHREPCS